MSNLLFQIFNIVNLLYSFIITYKVIYRLILIKNDI